MIRTSRHVQLAAAAAIAFLSGCTEAPSAVDHTALHTNNASVATNGSAAVAAGAPGLLRQVFAATSRFNSTTQATRAGYVGDPTCVAVPALGGMGHHWLNGALVDPVFNALEPEVVLYAPDRNGNMKLVAVEYIVINVGQPAPTFGGQAFDVGGTPVPVPHWSLHVWVHKDNPNGTFSKFNPSVSCP